MRLFLLRHSNATERDLESFADDSQRPLTKAGRKKLHKIVHIFQEQSTLINLILSSPFVRAAETAEILQESMRLKKKCLVLTPNLVPGSDVNLLIAEINARQPLENILLVGHEPDLGELISLLMIGDTSLPIRIKKAGICCLSIDQLVAGKCAQLEWLLPPALRI